MFLGLNQGILSVALTTFNVFQHSFSPRCYDVNSIASQNLMFCTEFSEFSNPISLTDSQHQSIMFDFKIRVLFDGVFAFNFL